MSQGKSSGSQNGIVSEARTGRMARVAVKMKRPDPNGNRRSRRAYVSLHKKELAGCSGSRQWPPVRL